MSKYVGDEPAARAPHPTTHISRTLYVLGYHKIGAPAPGGWETWFYIPPAIFERQLAYLRDAGWTVIDIATLRRSLDDSEAMPEHSVLLTFDDGCHSMYDVALPCLQRFRYPAVLFVPSDHVGGHTSAFDADEPDELLCTWDDLRALARAGVSIQSHSATHRHFSQLCPDDQSDELVRSKCALEEQMDMPVDMFAYPYGDCGRDGKQVDAAMRAAGYRFGCVYGKIHGPGPNDLPFTDPFRLKRVAMGPETDLPTVLVFRSGQSQTRAKDGSVG